MMPNKPDIHIVVAMTRNRLIGNCGNLPWSLPEDLKLFKALTMGQTLIMGRRTHVSIGRALPERNNIVISSKAVPVDAVESFPSFDEGIERAVDIGSEIFCIGGREIYRAALPMAKHLHISWVSDDFEGETFFPEFDLNDWQEISRTSYKDFTHVTYNKKGS
jgi:dihydrofolate reductase